jgi:hypothetical protein
MVELLLKMVYPPGISEVPMTHHVAAAGRASSGLADDLGLPAVVARRPPGAWPPRQTTPRACLGAERGAHERNLTWPVISDHALPTLGALVCAAPAVATCALVATMFGLPPRLLSTGVRRNRLETDRRVRADRLQRRISLPTSTRRRSHTFQCGAATGDLA